MSDKENPSPGQSPDPAAAAAARKARGYANLRPPKPGEVRNPKGNNGRKRNELVAEILEEPDEDVKESTRIREVVLATVKLAKSGEIGASAAQKTLIEQYGGKPKAQVDLTSSDGSMSPSGGLETSGERRARLLSILDKAPAIPAVPPPPSPSTTEETAAPEGSDEPAPGT